MKPQGRAWPWAQGDFQGVPLARPIDPAHRSSLLGLSPLQARQVFLGTSAWKLDAGCIEPARPDTDNLASIVRGRLRAELTLSFVGAIPWGQCFEQKVLELARACDATDIVLESMQREPTPVLPKFGRETA